MHLDERLRASYEIVIGKGSRDWMGSDGLWLGYPAYLNWRGAVWGTF